MQNKDLNLHNGKNKLSMLRNKCTTSGNLIDSTKNTIFSFKSYSCVDELTDSAVHLYMYMCQACCFKNKDWMFKRIWKKYHIVVIVIVGT